MTEGRKSVHASSFNSHPQAQREFDLTEWQTVLIPNGFNHVSLTGQIKKTVMKNTMVLELKEKPEDWTLRLNFIQYTALLLPKGYMNSPCGENLQSECELSQLNFFIGTSSNRVDYREGASNNEVTSQELPFEPADSMVELRIIESHLTSQKTVSVSGR